jgi:hypothetical protein
MKTATWQKYRAVCSALFIPCPWCDAQIPVTQKHCHVCKHFAHVPKEECNCEKCIADKLWPAIKQLLSELKKPGADARPGGQTK